TPERRGPRAGVVAAPRALHLDDLGPHVTEDLRAEGAGDVLREVRDDDPFQGESHGVESSRKETGHPATKLAAPDREWRTDTTAKFLFFLDPEMPWGWHRVCDVWVDPRTMKSGQRHEIGRLLESARGDGEETKAGAATPIPRRPGGARRRRLHDGPRSRGDDRVAVDHPTGDRALLRDRVGGADDRGRALGGRGGSRRGRVRRRAADEQSGRPQCAAVVGRRG